MCRKKRTLVVQAALLLMLSLSPPTVVGQECWLLTAGLNTWRQVMGPVDAECSWPRAPWGNWGVTSNFGHKENGEQFEGWHPTGGFLQWNSCTFGEYAPPNCSYYNWENCTLQVQDGYGTGWMPVDQHGMKGIGTWVSCPRDTDQDGWCDEGGCKDVGSFTSVTNWMTLYELDDWGGGDDFVQTLYFPSTQVFLDCTITYCNAAWSDWVTVSWYDPSYEQRADAQMIMAVYQGGYYDGPYCDYLRTWFPEEYDCLY